MQHTAPCVRTRCTGQQLQGEVVTPGTPASRKDRTLQAFTHAVAAGWKRRSVPAVLTDFHPVAPRHAAKRPGRRPHRCAHQHVNRKENRQAVGRQTAYIVLRRQLEDRAVQPLATLPGG